MEIILSTILSYLISLAVNERSAAIHKKRETKLQRVLENENKISKAIQSKRSLLDEVRVSCTKLAQSYHTLNINPKIKEPLWKLLMDLDFQTDIHMWLMTGGIIEGESTKEKLFKKIREAIPSENEDSCETFFHQLERTIFSNDVLSRWRHQQSLNFLRTEVTTLRIRAEEAAGVFSIEKQRSALDDYCTESFKSWDIIDLTNLPEGDVDIATQNLLVRQLYMPLRVDIEQDQTNEESLKLIERERRLRRAREAGRVAYDADKKKTKNLSIGELLKENQRLVILGDPGGGKTTMLRWLATAMLLRHRNDPALDQLPDALTLPPDSWIPVLIRCRDLGEADLCRSFSDFLSQHLCKSTLRPEQAAIMHALVLEKIAHNQVLLLIDGIDEITNIQVRVNFCQELERTAARYPEVRIIVTSRIVGYRDMPYRMGDNFQHGMISELKQEYKDLFAKRWIEVTEQRQPPEERLKREADLIRALHASDRIERLTGNPMLLTTLALVKRKVGKLPSRRNKLYAEAVGVLLNWNPRFYATIDDAEAIPQLEYLAFEMCRRGVQRITDDEIMDLLEQFRREYPSVRAVRNHSEADFLRLLEARSSILIKSGNIWRKEKQREEAAWEFRHLTFQEYLAARALIDGKYPNRDKSLSLSLQIAPLAGTANTVEWNHLENDQDDEDKELDSEINDPWTETLRLLSIDCKDDDVDDVLISILTPLDNEDLETTQGRRAILAALCLSDEPNVSEEVALTIINSLANQFDEENDFDSQAELAGVELCHSQWRNILRDIIIGRYLQDPWSKFSYASSWGSISSYEFDSEIVSPMYVNTLQSAIRTGNDVEATAAALSVMNFAFDGKLTLVGGLIEALLQMLKDDLEGNGGRCFAAAWALGWLRAGPGHNSDAPYWIPNSEEMEIVSNVLTSSSKNWDRVHFWLISILGASSDKSNANFIAPFLTVGTPERAQTAAIDAIGLIGDHTHIDLLKQLLKEEKDTYLSVHISKSLQLLGDSFGIENMIGIWQRNKELIRLVEDEILESEANPLNKLLLSEDIDGKAPIINWNNGIISTSRIQSCAKLLNRSEAEITQQYRSMYEKYKFNVASV